MPKPVMGSLALRRCSLAFHLSEARSGKYAVKARTFRHQERSMPTIEWTVLAILPVLCLCGHTEEIPGTNASKREKMLEQIKIAELHFKENISRWGTSENVDARSKAITALHEIAEVVATLSEEDEIRLRTAAIAGRLANILELKETNLTPQFARKLLVLSWSILIKTKALDGGKRLEELVAILGMPTKIEKDHIEWYFDSPMHTNPCLRLDRENKEFKITSY